MGLTIDSVAPSTSGTLGDYDITFTVSGPASSLYSLGLSFTTSVNFSKTPLFLTDSAAKVPPGTHVVTWRTVALAGVDAVIPTPDQIGRNTADVLIYGSLNIDGVTQADVTFGPYHVDNTASPTPTGGGSNNTFKFPVGGWAHPAVLPVAFDEKNPPVAGEITIVIPDKVSDLSPVRCEPFVYWRAYSEGIIEPSSGSGVRPGSDAGYGQYPAQGPNNTDVRGLSWPAPIAKDNVANGKRWDDWVFDLDGAYELAILTTNQRWMFRVPRDDGRDTTLPIPLTSHELMRGQYLKGYVDKDGTTKEYPDGYDWNLRPAWHRGREVWDTGDAWIQVATFELVDYMVCDTCHGRGWVVSGTSAPYDRVGCPNPTCDNGSDKGKPYREQVWNPNILQYVWYMRTRHILRPVWHRLSRWMDDNPLSPRRRDGFPITGQFALDRTQFIMGDKVSDLDAVLAGNGDISYYLLQTRHGTTRRLPADTEVDWPIVRSNNTPAPVRQAGQWAGVAGDTFVSPTLVQEDFDLAWPVAGELAGNVKFKDVGPVSGEVGPSKSQFLMGQADPDSHPLMANRMRPTQPGSLMVGGAIPKLALTRDLLFRFLQGVWDAYNTIHFQYTESDTTWLHMQFAQFFPDNSHTDWQDVRADNAVFDKVAGVWLVPPHQFWAYWDTRDAAQFPEGGTFRLRMRQYSKPADEPASFGQFVVSTPFVLAHGVANPISILKVEYEKWSHTVGITYRADDSQADAYTLTRFWYSVDDGATWQEISKGDIAGETVYVSAAPGSNLHQITWFAGHYPVTAGNDYRIKIEAVPSKFLDDMVIPFLKWLAPRNPYIDDAEQELTTYLGTVHTQTFNATTGRWEASPPYRTPGQIDTLEAELLRVKNHPDGGPNWFNFFTLSGGVYTLTDPAGYNAWLLTAYASGETHGNAMARVNTQLADILNNKLPAAQDTIAAGERAIRKRLIDQGYYAEDHFVNGHEAVFAPVVANRSGEAFPNQNIERWWNFRVQNAATGGTRVFNDSGLYDPQEITTLEQVFYRVQMDRLPTFDSQTDGRPLRDFFYDHTGARIGQATFFGGQSTPPPATADATQAARDQANAPANQQQAGDASTPTAPSDPEQPVVVGGALKILPQLLPGEQGGDQLAAGDTEFDGDYQWRVAAYNYIFDAMPFLPRPTVDALAWSADGLTLTVNYTAKAHAGVQTSSIANDGAGNVYGVRVSKAFLDTPTWDGPWFVNFVSDNRAAITEPSRQQNGIPWTPTGKDRPQPFCMYDERIQQYVIMTTKKSFDGTFRLVTSRAASLPKACEYDTLFTGEQAAGIFGAMMLVVNGTYLLFATVAPTSGPAYVAVSSSADGETWGPLVPCAGIVGSLPWVCYDGGVYHMWYQRTAGNTAVYYATSTDTQTWTPQNSDAPVYQQAGDVGRPSVVRVNGSWAMYLNDFAINSIISLVSADGVTWSGRRVELGAVSYLDGIGFTTAHPVNAAAYVDVYQGNPEVFLILNYVLPDNSSAVFTARLESRDWLPLRFGVVQAGANQLFFVPFSSAGSTRTFTVNADLYGFQQTDPVKVRIDFPKTATTPDKMEFYRQSDWVTITNKEELGAYMSPQPYHYSSNLLNYPYLRLGTNGNS
jgi:hypothetical protein